MERPDRLGELARRQLDQPLRDFVFVAAMIAMLLLSFAAVTGAASSLVTTASPAPQICKGEVARPIQKG